MIFNHNNRLEKGQVGLILIFLVAIALIVYAVTMNVGAMSKTKTLVTIAANTGASYMASAMASYGQKILQEEMGGHRKKCASTNLLVMIISFIIAVIIVVVSWGSGTALAFAIIGLALSAIAIVIQMVVIQPKITDLWNSIMEKMMGPADRIVETGILTGLRHVVTDNAKVPDVYDLDMDGKFGFIGDKPVDTVGRFSVYYNERLKEIKKVYDSKVLENFRYALADFIYKSPSFSKPSGYPYAETPDWGIFDPIDCDSYPGDPCCQANPPSICNRCCVPAQVPDLDYKGNPILDSSGNPVMIDVRPACCDAVGTGVPSCGSSTICSANSAYPNDSPPPSSYYPWLYDPSYQNTMNNDPSKPNYFVSFLEALGRDDERPDYFRDPVDINDNPQISHASVGTPAGYYIEDATGYVNDPSIFGAYYGKMDRRPGIFPFFYKIADWGMDLNKITPLNPATEEHCYWCDSRDTVNCASCPSIPTPLTIPYHPLELLPQLSLPVDPSTLTYNTTYFVDGTNNPVDLANPNNPPLAVDKITLPGNILAAETDCAEEAFADADGNGVIDNPNLGFWKRGIERFCNLEDPPEWPYELGCHFSPINATHNHLCDYPDGAPDAAWSECDCSHPDSDPDKTTFRADIIDDWVYGMYEMVKFSATLINMTPLQLSQNVEKWYSTAMDWFGEDGAAQKWKDEIKEVASRIRKWIEKTSYAGANCNEVWCVPPSSDPSNPGSSCPGVPDEELMTIDSNNNGVEGDMEDIVSCLNYNVEGYDQRGFFRMKKCLDNCSNSNCQRLPKTNQFGDPYTWPAAPSSFDETVSCTGSGSGGWNTSDPWYIALQDNIKKTNNPKGTDNGNATRFDKCAHTCSLEYCYKLPRSLVPNIPATGNYDSQNYHPVDPANADADWIDIVSFRDCLEHCSDANCMSESNGGPLPEVRSRDGIPYSATYPNSGVFNETVDCVGWAPGNAWYDAVETNLAEASHNANPDYAGVEQMLSCFYSCSDSNCQAMPTVQDDGTAYTWPADPSSFDETVECTAGVGNPLPAGAWRKDLVANVLQATGGAGVSSCDLNPGGWLNLTEQSALEAKNQVAKFKQRRNFLEARVKEAKNILNILDTAYTNFNNFLSQAVKDLETNIINNYYKSNPSALPRYVVYGWKTDISSGRRPGWHVVKVETHIPTRCNNACDVSQTGPAKWPRVKTWTENWGTKRCYKLINTDGVVKIRVTRYDEQASEDKLIKFPNGMPIWKFRFVDSRRPFYAGDLDRICGLLALKDPPPELLPAGVSDIYAGAFLMNKRNSTNSACWDYVHRLLASGVTTETCAEYYYHSKPDEDIGLKFVPCTHPF